MAQKLHCQPSRLIGLEAGSYEAWCIDEAMFTVMMRRINSSRGCNVKILSKLLGYADVTVTYNIYIHLFGDALEEMRSVIG